MSYKIPRHAAAGEQPPLAAEPPAEAASPATAAPPNEHVEDFYGLSVELTGFSEVELLGTGVGDVYLEWLARVFEDVLPRLLATWRQIAAEPPAERAAAVKREILDDAVLGPFARSILMLWYTATWSKPAWPTLQADDPEDVDRSFGAAYPEGLVWRTAPGAHPGGAKPTGFGTWAFAPEGA